MAMVMDLDFSNFNFNYCPSTTTTTTTSTTTTTTTTDEICNWSDFPPVVDWEALSGDQEDFHNLIDSMMEENSTIIHHQFLDDQTLIEEYNDMSPEYNTDIAPDQEKESAEYYSNMDSSEEDSKGLRLIHLLMAAAEALGSDRSRELARVILVRLKELASPHDGSNMERLAAHFTDALQGLLEGGAGCNNNKAHNHHQGKHNGRHYYKDDHNHHHHHHHQSDVLAAFQLLQDMSPYAKFGHFTANQAILEAVANDRRVHIVDYDIMEGVQWASFMQALASRTDGPPGPHLRITALSRGGSSSSGLSSLGTVQETGRRLTAFAASIGQPFSFHHCRLDPDEKFRPGNIKLVRGEALIVNCVLHMPHFSSRAHGSIESFLSGSKSLNPRLVTLVEEEAGPVSDGGFVGRFMDSLHHYSAVYDSLESGFPLQGRARTLVERVFLGPRICDSLGRIYRAREDEEGCSWARWLGAAGFSPVRISYANHCQAKLLVGLYNDGYKVEELSDNKLVLGWKSRRLFSASIWTFQDCDL